MSLGTLKPYDLTTANKIEGLIANTSDRVITLPNVYNQATRVVTITPGVSTQEATTYRLKETTTNQTISVVSDATPTAAEVVTLLKTAFQANPILNGLFTVSGTTTLVLTARQPGTSYSPFVFIDGGSTPTNVLTVAETTAATDPTAVEFGRAIVVNNSGVYSRISSALSSTNVFAGVTGFTYADIESVLNATNTSYPARAALNVVTDGLVCVYSDTAVDPTASVYVVHATGRFRATSDSSNTSQIASTVASWIEKTTSAGLTWLSLETLK